METKMINLKAAEAALREVTKVKNNLQWCRMVSKSSEETEAALARVKAAEAEYRTVADGLLGEAIKAAEGRATVRTICPAAVVEALVRVEETLELPSKKALEGVSVSVDLNAQDFPRAYKYNAESTQFKAVYKAGSWRVYDICRATTRRAGRRYVVEHTETSKAAILDRLTVF